MRARNRYGRGTTLHEVPRLEAQRRRDCDRHLHEQKRPRAEVSQNELRTGMVC